VLLLVLSLDVALVGPTVVL
jgi:hypothetical protein